MRNDRQSCLDGDTVVRQRRSCAAFVFRLSGAVCFASLLAACAPSDKSGRFSVALGKALRSGTPLVIDLATIEAPAWDELFVLAPNSTRDGNCQLLQLGWLECRTTVPSTVAQDEDFLVFRVKGRISRAERHNRANGDFVLSEPALPQPIKREAAKFDVMPAAGTATPTTPLSRLQYRG